MKEADCITIATDIDREGEAIARLIIQEAGCSSKNETPLDQQLRSG